MNIFLFVVLFVLACFSNIVSSTALVPILECPNENFKTNFSISGHPGSHPRQQTFVYFCYKKDGLSINFKSIDNNPTSTFTECNQPLYEQHVVEAFVTGRETQENKIDLHHYLELEVSPKGVLFAGKISNVNLNCVKFSGVPVNCTYPGLQWSAKINKQMNYWTANLFIPWSLIDNHGNMEPPYYFRANFMRISTPLGHNKEYSSWRTGVFNKPCFHMPEEFGTFHAVKK